MIRNTDSYLSPEWILEVFKGWFDPCPLNDNPSENGLEIEWEDKTYVNPPYSAPLKWVEKAIEESKKGKTIAMLLRVDTSTKWFSKIHEFGAIILWLNGRIKHKRADETYDKPTPANFASMLVIFPKQKIKGDDDETKK